MSARRPAGDGGASLLENLVVLSLVSILLGLSAFNARLALARERIDGWVRSMTYDIAAGRQAALTRRSTVTVTITSSSYVITAAGGVTLRRATLPADIALTTTCPGGTCSFDRRGVPLAAGTLTVVSASTGRSYTVRIESSTGRVSYTEP